MHQVHSSLLPWQYALRLILVCTVLHPFCAFASSVVAGKALPTPTVTLGNGRLVGTATTVPGSTVTVNQYLGVPFAEPPERFSPPKSRGYWGPYLTATAKSPACIQQFDDPPEYRDFKNKIYNQPPPEESEDCLYLNVYTPVTGIIDEPKAVLVFLYGGNLQIGSNAPDMYTGTSFAANQDVIVVAANYRTNVFGFPNTPQLEVLERNLGFLDQRLALEWVQANIYSFGGDPTKVTIFGQSAGSASVDILITSMGNKSRLPFRAGIMQSGQAGLYTNANTESNDYTKWNTLAKEVGCESAGDVIDCVRKVNATKIKCVLQKTKLRFVPVIDNVTMIGGPEKARNAGHIAQVPIMVGMNADEGRYFTYNVTDTLGWLKNFTSENFENYWKGVMEQYPISSEGSIANSSQQLSQIVTDFVFKCSASATANHSTAAGFPTWRYFFTAIFPNNRPFPNLGAFHVAEIPIVYGTYNRTGATKEQVELSKSMQTAWANFAKDPEKGPGWSESPNVHVFGAEGETDIPASELDEKCPLYAPFAEVVNPLMLDGSSANSMQQPLYYH